VLNEEEAIEPDWTMDKRYHFRVPEQEPGAETGRQLNWEKQQTLKAPYEDPEKYAPMEKNWLFEMLICSFGYLEKRWFFVLTCPFVKKNHIKVSFYSKKFPK